MKVKCRNCEWTGEDSGSEGPDEIQPYRDFWSRIAVGDEMPAGDCPECGAFAYLADQDGPLKLATTLAALATLRSETDEAVAYMARDLSEPDMDSEENRAMMARIKAAQNEADRIAAQTPPGRLVIEVSGGLVQSVTLDGKGIPYTVRDYDVDVNCSDPELKHDDDGQPYIERH